MSNQREKMPPERSSGRGYGCVLVFLLLTNLAATLALYFLLSEQRDRQNAESLAIQRELSDAVKSTRQEIAESLEMQREFSDVVKSTRREIADAVEAGIRQGTRAVLADVPGELGLGTRTEILEEMRGLLHNVGERSFFNSATSEQIKQKRAEAAGMVNGLPQTIRQELSENITRLNWMLEVLSLHVSPEQKDDAADVISRFQVAKSLSQNAVPDPPEHLSESLKKQTEAAQEAITQRVGELLSISGPTEGENVREAELLVGIVGEPALEAGLSRKLETASWERDTKLFARDKMRVLESAQKTLSPADLLLAAASIRQQSEAMRAQALTSEFVVPAELMALAQMADSVAAGPIRDYQRWALGEIEKVRTIQKEDTSKHIGNKLRQLRDHPGEVNEWVAYRDYPDFRKRLLSLAGIGDNEAPADGSLNLGLKMRIVEGLKTSWFDPNWKGQKGLAQALQADLVMVNLLPINEALLERPVADFYSEAYKDLWESLQHSEFRMIVAKASQTVRKRRPGDCP